MKLLSLLFLNCFTYLLAAQSYYVTNENTNNDFRQIFVLNEKEVLITNPKQNENHVYKFNIRNRKYEKMALPQNSYMVMAFERNGKQYMACTSLSNDSIYINLFTIDRNFKNRFLVKKQFVVTASNSFFGVGTEQKYDSKSNSYYCAASFFDAGGSSGGKLLIFFRFYENEISSIIFQGIIPGVKYANDVQIYNDSMLVFVGISGSHAIYNMNSKKLKNQLNVDKYIHSYGEFCELDGKICTVTKKVKLGEEVFMSYEELTLSPTSDTIKRVRSTLLNESPPYYLHQISKRDKTCEQIFCATHIPLFKFNNSFVDTWYTIGKMCENKLDWIKDYGKDNNYFVNDIKFVGENILACGSIFEYHQGADLVQGFCSVLDSNGDIDDMHTAGSDEDPLLIYPNPTSEKINFNATIQAKVTIYDSVGKTITSDIIDSYFIDVSYLSHGLYILKTEDEINHKSYIHKFVKL
jgi:hypothetical protein